jgi:hypothetical protein
MNENEKLRDIINSILDEYKHLPPYYTDVTLQNYLLYVIRTIENLHIKSMFPKESKVVNYFPSLIEVLFRYKKLDVPDYCSGNIVYLKRKNKDYFLHMIGGK